MIGIGNFIFSSASLPEKNIQLGLVRRFSRVIAFATKSDGPMTWNPHGKERTNSCNLSFDLHMYATALNMCMHACVPVSTHTHRK